MNVTKAIATLAEQQGISVKQVRADMIAAIHYAYITKRLKFTAIFGNRETSPEEYIEKMIRELLRERTLQ